MFLKLRLTCLTKFPCFLLSFVHSCNLFPIVHNTSSLSFLSCLLSLSICYSCCNIFLYPLLIFFFLSFSSVAKILQNHFLNVSVTIFTSSSFPSFTSTFLCSPSHTWCLDEFSNNGSWCVITLSITSLGEN